MDLNELPDDILRAILRCVNGIAAVQCRAVCRRWKEAVDSLSDTDWKKICENEYLYEDYAEAHDKYGLSWFDTYKALNSWSKIGSYEMSIQELCNGIEVNYFKVLPNGIVACLVNDRHKTYRAWSDTIVYYSTETFQKYGEEKFNFAFSSQKYDENEYFIVLLKYNGDLCIVLKENKQEFIVGALGTQLSSLPKIYEFTLIGKELYFKDAKEIIYVSKLKRENGKSTVETQCLEAFLENHESFEELVIAFNIKDGKLHILSDEGNKGNIYVHENADFSWAAQPHYDYTDLFIDLKEHGFNWHSKQIYDWISPHINLHEKTVFYSHGLVYLTTRFYDQTICIHYYGFIVHGAEHLLNIIKTKPQKTICIKKLFHGSDSQKKTVKQLDIIETSTRHKVIVLAGKNIFVLEFKPGSGINKKNKTQLTSDTSKQAGKKSINNKKTVLKAKKKTIGAARANKTSTQTPKKKSNEAEPVPSTSGTSVKVVKKSAKTAKKKTVCTAKGKIAKAKKAVKTKKVWMWLPEDYTRTRPHATRSRTSKKNKKIAILC